MKMGDFMKPIREELRKFEYSLQNDIEEFNSKLNSTRKSLLDYIDQQIEYLRNIKNEYNDELNYLDDENTKTCQINQQEFDTLCLTINQNDHDQRFVSKLFNEFKQTFPIRPKMVKSIPQYHFKNIQIDDLIIKQNFSISPTINHKSSSSEHTESSDHSFLPINDTKISSFPTTSIGSSYHKQLASQNNENDVESPSRLVSTCTTMSEPDGMLDILFRIRYQHNWTPRLMCFNKEENSLLIYLLSSHQLEYLSLNSRQVTSIDLPLEESILNLGYSTRYRLFYFSTRQTNRFVLFRLNEKEKQIEIEEEIQLIDEKDHFINVHIYENWIFFLYLTSSSIVMFGKYNLETSSFVLPSISYEKKLYDYEEKSSYKMIDFSVNDSFICFLIQLKNKDQNKKSKIIIHDSESMNKLHSFDLIDAIKPVSIVSTEKTSRSSATTISDDQIELLLYVNDPDGRLIHCCTYQEYLITTRVSNFGICSLDDGNLVLVAKKDIRVLNVQDYLKQNREHLD